MEYFLKKKNQNLSSVIIQNSYTRFLTECYKPSFRTSNLVWQTPQDFRNFKYVKKAQY